MKLRSPELTSLLSAGPGKLPLDQAGLRPAADFSSLSDAATLFPSARHRPAAFAGLLLRLGYWSESHAVAQDIRSVEGSYWHGILHRIEPDSSNARYWFNRVGGHPIFPELLQSAEQILERAGGPADWRLANEWDPFLFIEWCEEARESGGQKETTAIEIQMAEWQLLFNWCAGIES